jgi:hypothetical protein
MQRPLWKKVIISLICITAMSVSLFADSLIYDRNGAHLDNFSINGSDSNNPNAFINNNDYTSLPGYVGRLIYRGDDTTIEWGNDGPIATGGSTNNYYLTSVNSNSTWREIFFVVRVKGKTRNSNNLVNHTPSNNVIVYQNDSISIPGAGNEILTENGPGFDYNGEAGVYDGTNQYSYKYKYDYTILEITIIRTSNTNNAGWFGFWGTDFNTIVRVVGPSVHAQLSFIAEANRFFFYTEGSQYTFSVERTVDNIIPIETLISANNFTNRMQVGTVRYQSYFDNAGTVYFSSSSSTAAYEYDFAFQRTIGPNIYSFDYNVVFDASFPNLNPKKISTTTSPSSGNGFTSVNGTASSPLGGSDVNIQLLQGDISIYINDPSEITQKPPGDYSSTIYCLLVVN